MSRSVLDDNMLALPCDRNLLFGLVASQLKLISHAELVQATREWLKGDSRTLAEVLLARNALNDHECTLIDATVEQRLHESSNDIERGLATLFRDRAYANPWTDDGGTTSYGETPIASRSEAEFVEKWSQRLGAVQPGRSTSFRGSDAVADSSSPAGSPLDLESTVAPAHVRGPEVHRETSRNERSRFRTLWAHATGGLGEIFIAEDGELHRRVALKVIQSHHAGSRVSRERFISEAEITGNLEHPGIVPVYGFGLSTDGRPCYAMRFIKGESLAAAAHRFHTAALPDFQGREFRWLLQKFIDVCNPVAYAHSRGVVHRDLKPSNIMLGPFGETLVMDWGVAKLMRSRDASATTADESTGIPEEPQMGSWLGENSVTIAGQTIGTPAYMSPEQAAGRHHQVGPASDVYSLGATLFVLLTDRSPFEGEPSEVMQAVQRGGFRVPREITPRVPEPLDAICRRAMAREPSQRYSSALELANDIERWLADEPVSAWCEPWVNRARRWVRRHHPLVAGWAAAVVVALVALGVAVPLLSLAWGNESAARANERRLRLLAIQKAAEAEDQRGKAISNLEAVSRERAKALDSEAKANEEKDRAERALAMLVTAFRRPDPSIDGRSVKVVDLLERSMREIETSLKGQPLMEATLLTAIGETFGGLGMARESFAAFQRALNLRRRGLGDDHPDTLKALHHLAMAYQDAGRLDMAIPILERTLSQRKAQLGSDHEDVIESMNDLAVAYWEAGQAAKAIPLYETALLKVRAQRGADDESTLTITDNLGVALVAAGHADRAIALHESALSGMRIKLGNEQLATLVAMNNLALAYQAGGKSARSIELYETTLPKLRAKLGDDHPTVLTAMNGLARAYEAGGRLDAAIPIFEETLARRRAKLGIDHPDTLSTLFELASARHRAGHNSKAIELTDIFLEQSKDGAVRLPARIRGLIPRATALRKVLAEDSGTAKPNSARP
jgi:tetratricopeptide (TPR) repeat protein/tRNA A-37 threonylcarbamoyl transferase component Bud32